MKKKTWYYLIPICMCLAVLGSYRLMVARSSDRTPPVIRMEGELSLSVRADNAALLQGVTARDDRDGDVTASLVVQDARLLDSEGTVLVTYAAFDRAGNVSKAQRQIRYTDYAGPRFSLKNALIFQENTVFDLVDQVSASDPVHGDLSRWIRSAVLDSGSVSTVGLHQVQFQVTSPMGDTTRLVLPVEICAQGQYQGRLTLKEYLIYVPQGSSLVAEDYLDTFSLGAETFALNGQVPENFRLTVDGQPELSVPGTYSLDYTLTYTRGAGSYRARSRLIIVVEGQ